MFKKLKRVESNVKVLNRRKSPKFDAIFHITTCRDKAGLDVKFINSFKGRGVFTMSTFTKGEFVLEFRGQLINSEDSQRKQRIYHKYLKAFMFDFLWHGKLWTIDAAWDDGTLGRLVNDDHVNPNCKMKRIFVDRKPHLCLFALRDITHGEEITYEYRYADCPWRTQGAKCETDAGTNCLESDGSSANEPPYTKCSLHKSPSHIQASSKANTSLIIIANLPCNKLKNQLINIVPFESTRVCLQQVRGVDGPDYINVSFIGGYREKNVDQTQALIVWNQIVPLRMIPLIPNVFSTNLLPTSRRGVCYRLQKAYITTQDPLTETTEDLCRMMWEHNSTTRGMLTKLCEMAPDNLLRMIRQFQFTDWPKEGVLRTGKEFNSFVGQVHKTKVQFNQDGPITVHCSEGHSSPSHSHTFSIVLERRSDGVVDFVPEG